MFQTELLISPLLLTLFDLFYLSVWFSSAHLQPLRDSLISQLRILIINYTLKSFIKLKWQQFSSSIFSNVGFYLFYIIVS